MAELDFDDIDLDIDPEEEIEALADPEEESEESEEPEEQAEEAESEAESEPAQAEESNGLSEIENLRLDRLRLQDQLNELAMRSALDGRKLAEIEKGILEGQTQKAAQPVEEEGPTPQQIMHHLDQRIGQVEKALAKAEIEDIEKAPAFRKQLRQLERYYTDFKTNQMLEAAKGPDPQMLIQKAAEEAQTQQRYDAVRGAVKQEFPNLDPKSEYYNPALKEAVYEDYHARLNAGQNPTDALIKAVTLITKANSVKSMSELIAEQQALAARASDKPVVDRKKEAVNRNTKVAKSLAPNLADIGTSNSAEGGLAKYDFGKMGLKEFMNTVTDDNEEQIEEMLSRYEG
jgi:hypothetical protein